jgi:DNA-binding NarL/FixJ family response regulator
VRTDRPTRVLAVDRNRLMREGLALLIGQQTDMQLVGVVATPDEAKIVYAAQTPEVVVMDLDEPAGAALDAIDWIRSRNANVRVICLATYGRSAPGTLSCLGKDRLADVLLRAIRDTAP